MYMLATPGQVIGENDAGHEKEIYYGDYSEVRGVNRR
jgi:hypothetical protein